MKRWILLSCIFFLGYQGMVYAHDVEEVAIGTDQVSNGISDNRVVMWAVQGGWTGSGWSGSHVLYNYLSGNRRTLDVWSWGTEMSKQGDLFFPQERKLYKYATDQLIDIPWESWMNRGGINSAADVVWYGPDPVTGNYDVFLYEFSSGIVRNLSNTPSIGETSVIISDNGDVAWAGYSSPGYQVYVYNRVTGGVTQLSHETEYNVYPTLLDINADGDVLWLRREYYYYPNYDVNDKLYLYRKATGTTQLISTEYIRYARLSDNGDVAYLGGRANSESNVFLYKGSTGSTIQLTYNGEQWEPEINARGDVTWYGGYPVNYSGWDIFFYDSRSGEIEQLTQDGLHGTLHYYPQINASGDVTWIQHDYTYGARIFLAKNSIPMQVDIQPGSETSCINHDGNGVVPVAILGSASLNVRDIDPQSVRLESISVKVVGKNRLMVTYEDVNRDGIEDLVAQIQDDDGILAGGKGLAEVTANLYDGSFLLGADSICILGEEEVVWAVSAVGSSEWSSGEWSAWQATGKPNTFSCGDITTAWAPRPNGTDPEWLEVDFGTELLAKGLRVHETYESGFITQIDLFDGNGNSQTIWTGTDTTGCPGWFELYWGSPFKKVRKVKIYTQKDGWEEIDAVGLILAP